jgi:hypothetical protein
MILDICQVIANPEGHRLAQGFSEANLKWNTPSVLNYLKTQFFGFLLVATFLLICILNLKKRTRLIRLTYYASLVVFISIIVLNFSQWQQTGFDH